MALVLVATPGATTANTYVTLAGAETILEGELLTDAWDAASDANKNAALVSATRRIDQLKLAGRKYYAEYAEGYTNYQALHFPIKSNIDEDNALYIPEAVERATALEAAYLIRAGTSMQATADVRATGIKEFRTGKHSETLAPSTTGGVCDDAFRVLMSAGLIDNTVRIGRC